MIYAKYTIGDKNMEYKQNSKKESSARIKLDSEKHLWDLVLAGPSTYLGKGIYEVSTHTLEVLDKKGIVYKKIENTSAN